MSKRKLPAALAKSPTGIRGFDEITLGGLPAGRPSLICGSAGCGKTLFGLEFLVRGALEFDEPGVCLSFEETAEELAANVRSIGFDLNDLVKRNKLAVDHIFTERSLTEETGDYDLEGLFLRLGQAVDSVKAKRVLVDSLESLFAGFSNEAILRAELRRLFRWLKERGLTTVITAERGEKSLTRYGIEEYVSDCVVLLDNRVTEAVTTRRLRVVKYRGSTHGTNEYPFLIGMDGLSVLPVTSLELNHAASEEQVSTGLPELDSMLGGRGYYKGSSILISGTAGTGKTSLSCQIIDAACGRGERCVFFSFEESPAQVIRNMHSIGIRLERWTDSGLLRIQASRPSTFGLEMHLVSMHKLIRDFRPGLVVVDPVTALLHAGANAETRSMLLRLVDFLKGSGITAVMTTLSTPAIPAEQTEVDISSVVDTWVLLRDIESGGERNRGIYILKGRGLAHSNQIREFLITKHGLDLREVYLGAGLLTGSARIAQEARDATDLAAASEESIKRKSVLQRRAKALQAQIAALEFELETQGQELEQMGVEEDLRIQRVTDNRTAMKRSKVPQANGLQGEVKTAKAGNGGRK